MGGRIPTRWRRYDRDGRDGRENRLSFQIACSPLCNLANKSWFLDTFSKKDEQAMGFKVVKSGAVFETCITMLRQWEGKVGLFQDFFQNLYYYAKTMGGQKWGCFRNLYYYAETMGGQSRSFSTLFSKLVLLCWDNGWSKVGLFSKLVLVCWDNGRVKVMNFYVFYKNRISMLREGVRLGCNL